MAPMTFDSTDEVVFYFFLKHGLILILLYPVIVMLDHLSLKVLRYGKLTGHMKY